MRQAPEILLLFDQRDLPSWSEWKSVPAMGSKGSKLHQSDFKALANRTKFGAEELKEWYNVFVKDCPSGRLNKEKFVELYSKYYNRTEAGEFAEHVFRSFDSNHDGTIDFRELVCALSITTRGSPEEKLRWAFAIYDMDGNGYITRPELLAIIKSLHRMVGNSDKKIDLKNRLLKCFSNLDTNNDGKLSLDEFLIGARKDPTFVQLLQKMQ